MISCFREWYSYGTVAWGEHITFQEWIFFFFLSLALKVANVKWIPANQIALYIFKAVGFFKQFSMHIMGSVALWEINVTVIENDCRSEMPLGQVLRKASVKFNTQGTSSQSLCGSRKKEVLEKLLQNKVLWGFQVRQQYPNLVAFWLSKLLL